jgi:DNA repair protein RadC
MADQRDLFSAGVGEAATAPFPPAGLDEARLRLMGHGPGALDEGEALALLLVHRLRGARDAVGLAERLVDCFGGVGRVLGAAQPDLARVVGAEVAHELGLLHGVLLAVLDQPLRQRPVLSSWSAVQAYLKARLRALPREAFHVLFLDKRNQLIADERMGAGTVDHAPVYPREVVRRALELSASAIVLAHNHPSGDATPSGADIEITRQVVAAAKTLNIAVHDHLIVAGDSVASLKELGQM